MRKESFFRAVVVSLCVALLFPLLYIWAFGYGVDYDTPMDPAAFHSSSYEEQQAWLKEHSIPVSGFEVLNRSISDPRFWRDQYLELAVPVFLALFTASVLLLLWERKSSSNSLIEPTP